MVLLYGSWPTAAGGTVQVNGGTSSNLTVDNRLRLTFLSTVIPDTGIHEIKVKLNDRAEITRWVSPALAGRFGLDINDPTVSSRQPARFADKAVSAGGGTATVLPKTTLLNVQSADGTWDITAANVAAARAAGYRVYWVTDAAANQAPTAVDGLADKDVVNGTPALGVSVPAPTSVTIAPNQIPTANDAADTANDAVVLTKVTGVTWTVDGVDHPSSAITGSTKSVPYTKGTNTTVTAKPESASYEITNQTRSWTLTFTNVPAPTGGSVIFEDNFGTSALTTAQINARTTPVGGVAMATAGAGSITVNAAGHLVLDATGGNAALDFLTAGTAGKLTMTVESFTGNLGTSMVEMNLRSGTTGNKAVGRIMPTTSNGYYYAQTQVAGSTDYGTSPARVATYPSTFETTVTESGGSITTVIKENNANPSTHTKAGTFTGNGKVRLFVPTGGVLIISNIKLEAV